VDKKKKITKIASIIVGILLTILLIGVGFKLVQNIVTKASDTDPRDVVITGITANTAKIAWTTDQESQAVIEYGTSPTALNFFAPEPDKTKTHSVDLTLLSPGSTYYFQIRIGDKKYDNAGVPWTLTTKAANASQNSSSPAISPNAATPAPTTIIAPTESLVSPPTSTPLPTQTVVVPNIPTVTPYVVPTLPVLVCGTTDCQQVCLNQMWRTNGTCSTQDWNKSGCVGKVNYSTCAVITPTLTPTPTIIPTLTPTPTITPTPTNTPTPTPTLTPTPTPS